MLRPATFLRGFAAPARLLLPKIAPSASIARRCFTTTHWIRASEPPSTTTSASNSAPERVDAAAQESAASTKTARSPKQTGKASVARKNGFYGRLRLQNKANKGEGTATSSPAPATQPRKRPARPALPFFVARTPSNELPVYHLSKAGGNKKLTNIKKIEGDKAAFKQALAAGLGVDEDALKINSLTGHVTVVGHRKEQINAWLSSQGF
ncbi:hypothetical protein VTI74DRAFT_5741 [Chaetomium olivicolor]